MIETMQKRINEIKQQDRKSYYEIANEIGISESTLYKLMSKGELFTPAEQKIRKYLKDYKLKDEQIEQWKHEYEVLDACCELAQGKITELKAENDRLIEEIKEVKKYQYEQEYLDKEIEEMQKALKTLAEGLNKRQMLLQEIKEIAERAFAVCDDDCGNANKFKEIIELTKAEEE